MSPQRQWEREKAIRQARTPEEAIARSQRGMARVRAALAAALAGEPLPEMPAPTRRAEPRPAGYQYVACVGCYRPIYALPGSRCDSCPPPDGSSDRA
ncbi:hypothetical protein JNW90_01085 [Micromonospora sp. STR1s_5]|nr:hypothetical protein [Micromonospora sp. STR1s_5]